MISETTANAAQLLSYITKLDGSPCGGNVAQAHTIDVSNCSKEWSRFLLDFSIP